MNQIIKKFTAIAALALLGSPVQAMTLSYDLTDLGGGSWQYDYSIFNDTGAPFDGFSIYFDPLNTANLVAISAPAEWDVQIFPPGSFALDRIYDAGFIGGGSNGSGDPCADGSPGFGIGQSAGLFSVAFDWLDTDATPGAQPYDLYNCGPNSITVLTDENNKPVSQPAVIPIPAALWLFATGLLGLVAASRAKAVSA